MTKTIGIGIVYIKLMKANFTEAKIPFIKNFILINVKKVVLIGTTFFIGKNRKEYKYG